MIRPSLFLFLLSVTEKMCINEGGLNQWGPGSMSRMGAESDPIDLRPDFNLTIYWMPRTSCGTYAVWMNCQHTLDSWYSFLFILPFSTF